VQARLRRIGEVALVKVIAPVPQFDYAKLCKARSAVLSDRRWDQSLEVLHPAWIYPPGGFALNPALLFLQLLPLINRIYKIYSFDLLDAHFAFPDGIAACLLAGRIGVPFTVTLRGNETMHARYALRRRLMAWSLRRASRVIALSSELRDFAVSLGVRPERIKIISNGVDSAIFRPRDRGQARVLHGLGENDRVVLSAGALIERKGHHHVVQAVAELRKKGLDIKLLIAGGGGREGDYEDRIRKEVEVCGVAANTRFLGELSPGDLALVMSAADVFCLASSREGWPNVVHESLACGTPVVATNVGAIADLIPSPDYGFITPAGDIAALEQALLQALSKEWDRERISAWAHARSWEQVALEVVSEFESVAGLRSGKAVGG
jgi:glycosyltransferase involved in cell wall biosynthesis